jgi:hypothetical protein
MQKTSIDFSDIDLSDIESFEVEVLDSYNAASFPDKGGSRSCSCSCCVQQPT